MLNKRISLKVAILGCLASAALMTLLVLGVSYLGDTSESSYQADYDHVTNSITSGMGVSEYALDTDYASDSIKGDANFSVSPESQTLTTNRKLVRKASVTVETTEYDDYLVWLENIVATAGGYFESKEQYNWEYNSTDSQRNLDAIIKVPVSNLDTLLDSFSLNGEVTSRTESQEDITESYTDVDAHLESIRIEQKRLNELLAMAETVEDILAIEDRLSQVRYEIENYERQLRGYDSQLEYSRVQVSLREVIEYTADDSEDFFSRCLTALQDNLEWLVLFIQSLVIFIFGHLPTIGVVVVLLLLAFRLYQKRVTEKSKRMRKVGEQEDQQSQ